MAEMWYYTCEGKQMDPVPMREMKRLAGDGTLKPTDMVWKEGMPRWIRASSLKELFPDPIAALDQYFTNTSQAEKKDPLTTGAAPAGKSAAASAAPATKSQAVPKAEEDAQPKKKRKPSASEADEDASRPPRRRAEGKTGGGSGLFIIIALVFGAFVLLGALGGGVILLIVMTRPGADGDPKPQVALDPKNGPGDGNPPAKEGPKEPPLPPGVRQGSGAVDSPLLKQGGDFLMKFRVKAGYQASIKVTALRPTADFNIYVYKDSNPANVDPIITDVRPDANANVTFSLPVTEIVRVRVHNNSMTKMSQKCTVFYDVSPP